MTASALATAGGIVFGGTADREFFALQLRHRRAALADAAERRRLRSADHLRGGWHAVRGDHGRRPHGTDDVVRPADERHALGRHRAPSGSLPLPTRIRCRLAAAAWRSRLMSSSGVPLAAAAGTVPAASPGSTPTCRRLDVERRVHRRAGLARRAAVQAGLRHLPLDRGAGRQSALEVGQRDARRSLHRDLDDDAAEQPGQPVAGRVRQHPRLLPAAERARAGSTELPGDPPCCATCASLLVDLARPRMRSEETGARRSSIAPGGELPAV